MEAEQTTKVSAAPDWLLDTAALAPLHSLILSLSFLPSIEEGRRSYGKNHFLKIWNLN